ncbi:hypothetical protein ABT330_13930 [Streptomyces sp. NPDC000658]|uniref:hypothetical protein n=1 Tax=Streptomyces sp. NPDC000658 TaxID=3154266 RepID=UPI003320D85E
MQNSVITASGALLAAFTGLSGALWATISNQRKQQPAQRDAWKKTISVPPTRFSSSPVGLTTALTPIHHHSTNQVVE